MRKIQKMKWKKMQPLTQTRRDEKCEEHVLNKSMQRHSFGNQNAR